MGLYDGPKGLVDRGKTAMFNNEEWAGPDAEALIRSKPDWSDDQLAALVCECEQYLTN